MDSSQFGYVVTVGSASYAVFVVINGFVVDKIGGKKAMVIGALGSAVFNVCQGLFALLNRGRVTGMRAIVVICIIYACNNFFQTFCTSAICKVAVNWYNIRERGYFSGVFGVIISLGFYFAYQVNGVVYGTMHWCWIFFIPAAQLAVFGVLNLLFAHNTPDDAGLNYNPFECRPTVDERQPLLADGASTTAAPPAKPAPKEKPSLFFLFKTVFGNPIFIVLCAIDICLGWNRDGVLAWYPEVLNARFGSPTTSNQYAVASGGTTIGGMFGSLSAGMLSDSLFHSRRTPVAFLFYCCLAVTYSVMLFMNSSWGFAVLVAVAAVWLNGLNGLITSTCAMDFAGSAATATAVGLLDGIQKIGSSAAGFMGHILKEEKGSRSTRHVISKENYQYWVYAFLPPAAFAIGLLLTIIDRKPPAKPATQSAADAQKPAEEAAVPTCCAVTPPQAAEPASVVVDRHVNISDS